jgi:tetratricopeptide (TPR) repeat protein
LWLEATQRAPDHWLPKLALGEALHEEGRHEEAIAMFRESIALRPTRALAYVKLGQCQLEMKQLSDEEESFARSLDLAPDSAEARFGLGVVALRVRDSRVAREYFLETFSMDPGNVKMRHALAQVTAETDPAEALGLCEEIQQLAPQAPGDDECVGAKRERLRAVSAQRP